MVSGTKGSPSGNHGTLPQIDNKPSGSTKKSGPESPSGPSQSEQFGLRRRSRAGVEDPERGGGDTNVGRSTALRAPVEKLKKVAYREGSVAVTQSAAFAGMQFMNVDTAGPQGKTKPPKWPKLDAGQFQITVSPNAEQRMTDAQAAITTATNAQALLADPTAPATAAAEPGMISRMTKATAQVVGLADRQTVQLSDVMALRTAGEGGNPDHAQHNDMKAVTSGKVKLVNAAWVAANTSLQTDRVVANLKASYDAQTGPDVDTYVASFRSLAKTWHEAQAKADAPIHGEDPAQLKSQADQAKVAFDSHFATLPISGGRWEKALRDMLELESGSMKAVAARGHALDASLARVHRVQQQKLRELAANPPGLNVNVGSLKNELDALRDRLLQPQLSMTAVAPNDVMEMTLTAATQIFGGAGASRNTAQALHVLSRTRIDDLGDLIANRPGHNAGSSGLLPPNECAASLAVAIGRLPRGAELLGKLCGPSNFLQPDPTSNSKEDKAAAKELGSRRAVALRTLCSASFELEHRPVGSAPSPHLQKAKDAAHAVLQLQNCNVAELPDGQRYAFNCVRNQFYELGGNSTHAEAVTRLKQVAGPMLTSKARETSLAGTVARYNPVADATPFNPAAMNATGTALKQGRLIVDSMDAMRDLRTAAEPLRSGASARPAEKALKTVADLVLGAVPANTPELIGKLNAGHVAIPKNFGLSDADLQANPKLADLWHRYENRDSLDHIANAVKTWLPLNDATRLENVATVPNNFGMTPEAVAADPRLSQLWSDFQGGLPAPETASRLARIARDDLFSASLATPTEVLRDLAEITSESLVGSKATDQDKKASEAIVGFRKALDSARASGIWENAKINTPQELADAIVALFRVQRLRSRAILKGDQTFGVDLGKFAGSLGFDSPMGMNFRVNAGGRFQSGFNLEFGLSTSSYYAIIGQQRALTGKGGAGVGVSAAEEYEAKGQPFTIGARIVEASATGGGEYQWQEGLRVLIPRDKTTEARNLKECELAMRHMVMSETCGYPDPAQAIMTNVDAASLNVLGTYDRKSLRSEATLGTAPLQVGMSRVQLRAAETSRSSAESKWGELTEVSGYYKVQDVRVDHARQVSGTHTATTSLRVGQWELDNKKDEAAQGDGAKGSDSGGRTAALAAGDMISYNREGKIPHQDYTIMRMVTMDDELLAKRSRLIQAFSDMEPYKEALNADRARWIQFGAEYSKFPEDFTESMKLQSSERDYDNWLASLEDHHTTFSEYGVVKCLQDEVPASMDTLAAKLMQNDSARQSHATEQRGKDLNAQGNLTMGDINSWEPRRSSNNMTSVQANRPGYVLGIVAGSGGDAYVIDNLQLLPRA